jgi:hypothetical protein
MDLTPCASTVAVSGPAEPRFNQDGKIDCAGDSEAASRSQVDEMVAPAVELLATDSTSDPLEIDQTDKTCDVTNEKFLQAIFGKDTRETRPVLVSFMGNPMRVPSRAWYGQSWNQETDLPANANNYFSLAEFKPDEAGRYRRIKARFHALHAVMLDDIGGKVEMCRLTLGPSWILETSPGNYQVGYLLREPILDGLAADRLMNAVVAAGLCDPGANGPRARLARLPVGINGKHDPPFLCRTRTWNPKLIYSVEELVDGLQLDIRGVGRPVGSGTRSVDPRLDDGESVYFPRPDENVVLNALQNRGLYKAPLGEGKHDITCPWVEEHTEQADHGTAYFEPDDFWPIGGFKCLHGHCANRHIRDLLRVLDIEAEAARMKSTIRAMAGEMHRVVDAAEQELARSKRFYQRGGLIVTVVTDPSTRETRIQEISQPALARALAGAATWERYDARSKNWTRIDPPARHVSVLYDVASYPHLPILNGLARQPYLRADGSLMTKPGYDEETGMFGVFDGRKFSVPDHPARAEAEESLTLLKDLLVEFSFAGQSDLAAALAAMLSATIRPSLPHAPMFHVRAHMVGSGKSYLCELFTALATPQRGTPMTFPGDDEECRKTLLAALLRAPAVIEFDNLTGDILAHKSLCTALTSEFITGRILGVSKTATVSTRALFLSSGNNVGPIQDMTRRCISIRLDPGCETPATRNFKRPDLVQEVLAERGRYVSAALTIVRAWIVAGQPKTTCKSLAGYGLWSELCRQPLLWLGCNDPMESMFEAMAEDPDRETLKRLLAVWRSAFGKAPAMVRDAVNSATRSGGRNADFLEVLRDIAGERDEINRRKLGRWIKRNAGRIVDGQRFVRSSGKRSAEAWQVETVESVSPVSSDSVAQNEKSVREASSL